MKRRSFLRAAALVGVGTSVMSCGNNITTASVEDSIGKGYILHHVSFWLKEGITTEEETDFLNFFEELKKVPGIHTIHYGKVAGTTARDVVDQSFSYNLIVSFKNLNDIEIYENDPGHLAASAKYGKYWTKVLVMDTEIL